MMAPRGTHCHRRYVGRLCLLLRPLQSSASEPCSPFVAGGELARTLCVWRTIRRSRPLRRLRVWKVALRTSSRTATTHYAFPANGRSGRLATAPATSSSLGSV